MPKLQETITSRSNSWVRQVRRAAARDGLTAGGCVLAESPHLLEEALRSRIWIERVFVTAGKRAEVANLIPPHLRVPLHAVSDRLFGSMSTTSNNQGVLTLLKLPVWTPDLVFNGLTVALNGIQDPGNAGTIARSAEAFGASGVVFMKGSAAPTNPKALRAAAGSLFRVPILHGVDAATFLRLAARHGKTVFAPEARGGTSLCDADLSEQAAVVIGSETQGVDPVVHAAATPIAIPTLRVESLNAAAAAAIILYEAARRQHP